MTLKEVWVIFKLLFQNGKHLLQKPRLTNMKIEKLKDLIQSCHINFMLGSGISRPYLSTLNNIETLLTELSQQKELEQDISDKIKASIYKVYFSEVMWPNHKEYKYQDGDENKQGTKASYDSTLSNYKSFLIFLNEILLFRYSGILNKQINLFSTNIDLFVEKAIEDTKHEFNDGFKGRLQPTYDLSNFQKSYSKTTLQYENKSEIPVFNILKVHGSLNWEKDNDNLIHSDLSHILEAHKQLTKLDKETALHEINKDTTVIDLIETDRLLGLTNLTPTAFLEAYEKILVVNPTKEKFERSVIDDKFYELLRLYANSLERENSILFVLGFSFADEHIRDITLRAANSNPTLQIIVFAFDDDAKEDIETELRINKGSSKNNNIRVISPVEFLNANYPDKDQNKEKSKDIKHFDFKTIVNEVYKPIANLVRIKMYQ